jgi:hypothetical protein
MDRQRVGTHAPKFRQTPPSEDDGRGLDLHDIAERKAFLDLDAGDCERLTRLHALIEAEKTSFSEAFYDHLLRFEPLRRMMPDDRKRPPVPPTQSRTNQVMTDFRNGSSSSIRLFGQVGNFSSVSRSHAAGSRPLSRAVPIRL